MNRMQNLNKFYSNSYSGNNKTSNFNNEKKPFNDSYSGFNKSADDNLDTNKDNRPFHEYKGMDGKLYYNEQLLDLANKEFLEKQNH